MNPFWHAPITFSQVGESHALEGTPCQDAYFAQTEKNSQWAIAVVCDGAGSARFSRDGARLTAELFGKSLLQIIDQLEFRSPGHWINDLIIQCALDVRNSLRVKAGKDDLRDYHTTLVAVLIGQTGGFLIHIGDGAAFGGRIKNLASGTLIDDNFVISLPENGEYSNETFFVTEGDWVKHLRITPLPQLDWVMLGSDGGCSIVLKDDKRPREEFFIPFFSSLIQSEDLPSELLNKAMTRSEWRALTNDDRTIVFLFSDSALRVQSSSLLVAHDLEEVLQPVTKKTSQDRGVKTKVDPLSRVSSALFKSPFRR